SRSIAPGSSFHRSLPGIVVPPPARVSRDRPPTARAARISALSGSLMAPRAYPVSRLGGGRERGETLEAELALERRADGRQRPLLEVPLRLDPLLLHDPSVFERDEGALIDLAAAQCDAGVVLDDLERETGGGKERRALALADPERTAHAAGAVDAVLHAFV